MRPYHIAAIWQIRVNKYYHAPVYKCYSFTKDIDDTSEIHSDWSSGLDRVDSLWLNSGPATAFKLLVNCVRRSNSSMKSMIARLGSYNSIVGPIAAAIRRSLQQPSSRTSFLHHAVHSPTHSKDHSVSELTIPSSNIKASRTYASLVGYWLFNLFLYADGINTNGWNYRTHPAAAITALVINGGACALGGFAVCVISSIANLLILVVSSLSNESSGQNGYAIDQAKRSGLQVWHDSGDGQVRGYLDTSILKSGVEHAVWDSKGELLCNLIRVYDDDPTDRHTQATSTQLPSIPSPATTFSPSTSTANWKIPPADCVSRSAPTGRTNAMM